MRFLEPTRDLHPTDTAPGDQRLGGREIAEGLKTYLIGLGLATLLTIVSFFIAGTTLVWGPSIPVALVVLAIAQMGVHLVFFLHITTGPDNVNNILALAFGVLIVLLILVGSLWIMSNLNRNMASADQVTPMLRERGSLVRTVTTNGIIGPTAMAPVGARVSGVVQAVYCDADKHVKAGELCAKIDPYTYQIAVEQSIADLAAADARYEKDKADLGLAKASLESHEGAAKHPSRKTIEELREAVEQAETRAEDDEARITHLRATLHAAETNLADTDIVAPIDGSVASRNVELGQTVEAGSATPPLFVIAGDLTLARIDAIIGAKDIDNVKLGETVTFTLEAFPNRPFSGVVTEIRPSPQTSQNAATYQVLISAPNPELVLEPGMVATIRIAIE